MEQIALDVRGMSCGHCVKAVTTALTEIKGVDVKSVSIGSATVALDPSRASLGDVIDALSEAGYEADLHR